MRNMVLYLISLLAMTYLSCTEVTSNQKGKSDSLSSQKDEDGGVLKLKKFSYIDKEGIGIEAFSFLMPIDWTFSGGIKWALDNPGMPASAAFKVTGPAKDREFEVFSSQAFFWTNNPMLLSTFPVGTKYFGSEVLPVVTPVDALKKIVLPRFRNNTRGLKIIEAKDVPELAKAVGAGMQSQPGLTTSSGGAKVRIEYNRDGKLFEEEIYAVVESYSYPVQSMSGTLTNTNWLVDYIFSFKAEKGKLEASAKILQTIAFSFKLNPQWFNKYNQVIYYLAQMQIKRINSIGELSKIISRTHDEISNMMMESYNNRQAVNDKINQNFSDYVLGIDRYDNPFEGKQMELPSGYRNAWVNPMGEVIMSDDVNYNPNVGSNLKWEQMQRK